MDWWQQSDNYCERTDFSFWSEPLNAVTNIAFILSVLIVFAILRREGRLALWEGTLLAILSAIGIGSFLFHTFATSWAALADVLPILLFILVYVGVATVRFFGLPWWAGPVAVVLFFPYAFAVGAAVSATVGDLNGSVAYVPVPILILIYAALLWRRAPRTARGLAIGAAILVVSLTARTVDEAVCDAFPIGTHIFWHILNGIMLGWMILVLARGGDPRKAST
ncbi:MAG: ceramidase domain-containing protein [Rubricella sp.]